MANSINLLMAELNTLPNALKWLVVYVDDLIIYSEDMASHLEHLSLLFEKLLSINLKLKLAKCQLCRKEIQIFGFNIKNRSF